MWKLESERHDIDLGVDPKAGSIGIWATSNTAIKDDGTRVHNTGMMMGYESFTYDDSDVSFEFSAQRIGASEQVLGAYTVYLGSAIPLNITLEKARIVGRNIREALLFLPPAHRQYNGEPPTAVEFEMSLWDKLRPDAKSGENFP
jgi:hypothetical protein